MNPAFFDAYKFFFMKQQEELDIELGELPGKKEINLVLILKWDIQVALNTYNEN